MNDIINDRKYLLNLETDIDDKLLRCETKDALKFLLFVRQMNRDSVNKTLNSSYTEMYSSYKKENKKLVSLYTKVLFGDVCEYIKNKELY